MRAEVNESVVRDAKKFLREVDAGVLSTLHNLNGTVYPFGSMTPYITTLEGELAILISDIAVHTKNIKEDPKASITIFQTDKKNKQAASRISVTGDVKLVEAGTPKYDQVSERYLKFFPEAKSYFNTHNFNFYTITPLLVHYIQTFGKIYTFDGALLKDKMPEWYDDRNHVMDHMNNDHKSALVKYAAAFPEIENTEELKLAEMDQYGFHLSTGRGEFFYMTFEKYAENSNDLRKEFTQLARK
jgi:putative heme iron utilization protein